MSDQSTIQNLESAHLEIERLREELRKNSADLATAREEARRKMQEFARDFRVPLATILGFSDLLSAKDRSHSREWSQIAVAGHELMELIKSLERPLFQPVAKESEKKTSKASAAYEPSAPVVHTILHIEDNETNFRLTERILEDRPNIKLLWASNGAKGLAFAAKHTPALILLDLNLPDSHGSDVLTQLRNNPVTQQTPVIVMSADASPTQIERMLQAGARNYLTKPFDIKEFLCLVDEALRGPAKVTA